MYVSVGSAYGDFYDQVYEQRLSSLELDALVPFNRLPEPSVYLVPSKTRVASSLMIPELLV